MSLRAAQEKPGPVRSSIVTGSPSRRGKPTNQRQVMPDAEHITTKGCPDYCFMNCFFIPLSHGYLMPLCHTGGGGREQSLTLDGSDVAVMGIIFVHCPTPFYGLFLIAIVSEYGLEDLLTSPLALKSLVHIRVEHGLSLGGGSRSVLPCLPDPRRHSRSSRDRHERI